MQPETLPKPILNIDKRFGDLKLLLAARANQFSSFYEQKKYLMRCEINAKYYAERHLGYQHGPTH